MRSLVHLQMLANQLGGSTKELQMRMKISPEVQSALKAHKPVVALESTIITHGMDYPTNLKTALEVEEVVRSNGALPATIAIISGIIRVGLSKEDIEFLAKLKRSDVRKCSKRYLLKKLKFLEI